MIASCLCRGKGEEKRQGTWRLRLLLLLAAAEAAAGLELAQQLGLNDSEVVLAAAAAEEVVGAAQSGKKEHGWSVLRSCF